MSKNTLFVLLDITFLWVLSLIGGFILSFAGVSFEQKPIPYLVASSLMVYLGYASLAIQDISRFTFNRTLIVAAGVSVLSFCNFWLYTIPYIFWFAWLGLLLISALLVWGVCRGIAKVTRAQADGGGDGGRNGAPTPSVLQAKNDAISRIDAYTIVSNYDTHFSTVRMTLVTFLVSFSFGLASFLLKDSHGHLATTLGILVPAAFLVLALFLNSHFQRLTTACKKIQEWLESLEVDPQKGVAFGFRTMLSTYYRDHTSPWTWKDPANRALGYGVALYLVSALVFIFAKAYVPEEVCVVQKGSGTVICGNVHR